MAWVARPPGARPTTTRTGPPASANVLPWFFVILLDGETLDPAAVARVARERAPVKLTPAAHERNAAAARALDQLIAAGEPIYGVTTGVGALRDRPIDAEERSGYSLRLLRSHACGAGRIVPVQLVRAAMVTRANQIGAGGPGLSSELLDALVAALNAGLTPFTRELGSLGTGDLTALADIALALLGEGRVWEGDELLEAGPAIAARGIAPRVARTARRTRVHLEQRRERRSRRADRGRRRRVVACVAERRRTVVRGGRCRPDRARSADSLRRSPRRASPRSPRKCEPACAASAIGRSAPGALGIQDPYPFRALPQVDGAVHDALGALRETVIHELNFAGENALIVADEPAALPNGNPHAAPLANAIDNLRTALAQSAALIAARVSALLDPSLTGLPPFLAARPDPSPARWWSSTPRTPRPPRSARS